MQKIRALYLSPVPDFKGGAERSLFDLLANPTVTPLLAVPEEGELSQRARLLGIPVIVIDFGTVHRVRRPFKIWHGIRALSDAWRASRRLLLAVETNKVDLVHTNGLKAHSIALLMKLGGAPRLVMHFRDIAYTAQEKAVWKLQTTLATRAIFVSRACYPGGQLPRNGRVIFNGIDPRPQVSLCPPAAVRIGFIGRIHPHKGLHTLLDWVHFANIHGIKTHVFVRGKFSQEAPDYENEIKQKVVTLGLQEFVTFEGFLNDPDAVYEGIDVVCAPAQAAEPLARTILEPMSMGLPVIATPTGGTTEMILNNVTGFLVTEPEGFAQAITTVGTDPVAMSKIVTAGRDHVNKHFSKQKLHNSIHTLYSEILSERNSASN